jgi:hypothetical protein
LLVRQFEAERLQPTLGDQSKGTRSCIEGLDGLVGEERFERARYRDRISDDGDVGAVEHEERRRRLCFPGLRLVGRGASRKRGCGIGPGYRGT